MTMSCVATTPQVSFSGASPLKKVRLYSSISTRGFESIMLHQREWSERCSSRVFYWLMAASDMTQLVRSYRWCQYFVRQIHAPAQELQSIPMAWPFAMWGRDLLGPFKKVLGGLTHLLVAIDKFTKWIEVRPLAKIGSK
jgi:hypothetical protein